MKLLHGQLLLYPTRAHDRPEIGGAAALHAHDGAGNTFNAVYGNASPVLLLVRFTNVIAIENPKPLVDRLAWIVVSNCVALQGQGPGANPAYTGYSITVVDATTGLALLTVQSGPPLDIARLGVPTTP